MNDDGIEVSSMEGVAECSIKEFRHSEKLLDSQVLFQVVDIGRQLIVWIGTSDEMKLTNLYLTGLDFEKGPPSVSELMSGGPSCGAESLAQRVGSYENKEAGHVFSQSVEHRSNALACRREEAV